MKKTIWLSMITLLAMFLRTSYVMAESKNVTMQVGETKTFYLPASVTGKNLKSVAFYSNGISYVQVLSYTTYSVRVKAIKAFSSPVIVRCDYYYYLGSGTYTYQAKGYYDFNITVVGETKAKPTKITLPSVVSIEEGGSQRLVPTITPANAEYTLTWKITNTSIASVNQYGLITGNSVGETDLKVSADNGVYTMCRIVVYKPSASRVTMQSSLSLNVGETETLMPTVYPSNADYTLSWASSDNHVVTVSSTGEVNAVSAGDAIITVQTDNGISATCNVTVNQPLGNLTFTLGEIGGESYKAYVTHYAADFTSSTVQAFIVTYAGDEYVTLEEVTKAPKGTPLLLKGVQGECVTIPCENDVSWDRENILKGTVTNMAVNSEQLIYVPAYHDSKWGFYRFAGTLPSNKVYLDLGDWEVKANRIGFWADGATSLPIVQGQSQAESQNHQAYDLSGRAIVSRKKNEVVVINGKKVLVK